MTRLKCSECGGEIELEEGQTIGVCHYCGSKVVISSSVVNNNVTVNNNSVSQSQLSPDELAASGETFIQLGEYDRAIKTFFELTDCAPSDFRGWWGLTRAKLMSYHGIGDTSYRIDYGHAIKLASEADKARIKAEYKTLLSAMEQWTRHGQQKLEKTVQKIDNTKLSVELYCGEAKSYTAEILYIVLFTVLAAVSLWLSFRLGGELMVLSGAVCAVMAGLAAMLFWYLLYVRKINKALNTGIATISELLVRLGKTEKDRAELLGTLSGMIQSRHLAGIGFEDGERLIRNEATADDGKTDEQN